MEDGAEGSSSRAALSARPACARGPTWTPGGRCLKPGGGRRQAEVGGAGDELRGGALADRRDRQRRVDAEAGRDHRGVHAEEALVAEHLAAVVDDAEADLVGHPAAAERVRGVDARRSRSSFRNRPTPRRSAIRRIAASASLADPRRLLGERRS